MVRLIGREPYSAQVLRLFEMTPRAGRAGTGPDWATGESHEPLSATQVRAHLRVVSDQILEARYEVRGCPVTVAAAALIAERWSGRTLPDARIAPRAVLADLEASVSKLGRVLVVESAFQKALQAARTIA